MSYSNFTLELVVTKFELEKTESIGIFSEIEPITPSDYLITGLAKSVILMPGRLMVGRMALDHVVKVRVLPGQFLYNFINTPLSSRG